VADNSYFELVTATVELNLSDFREKMFAADMAMDEVASGPDVKREGSSTGFSDAADAMIDSAIGQMEDFVAGVMMASQVEVPKDTEVLANSARPLIQGAFKTTTPEEAAGVGVPVLEGNRVKVTFGYGYGTEVNPKTKRLAGQYALPVHEIYEAHHEPPTKSHYLMDPLIERSSEFGTELGAAMNAGAKKGEALFNYRVNRSVFLFRKGGGAGVNPVFGPNGIIKRKRG